MAARPTAAAGLLACAVLLLFAGQSSAGILDSNFPCPLAHLFPAGYVPPVVKIYCKENTTLNMAASNGKFVMVPATNNGDKTQLWWQINPGGGDKYWLVNVGTWQAMTSPGGNGQLVQLAQLNILSGAQLWVPSTPGSYGFHQIKPYTNGYMALNGLYGGVRAGTEIGIWYSEPVSSNTLWHMSNVFPCPLHFDFLRHPSI